MKNNYVNNFILYYQITLFERFTNITHFIIQNEIFKIYTKINLNLPIKYFYHSIFTLFYSKMLLTQYLIILI